MVKAVHPKPVNHDRRPNSRSGSLISASAASASASLARTAWAGVMKAAREMAEQGTFNELANGFPGGELNKMFK